MQKQIISSNELGNVVHPIEIWKNKSNKGRGKIQVDIEDNTAFQLNSQFLVLSFHLKLPFNTYYQSKQSIALFPYIDSFFPLIRQVSIITIKMQSEIHTQCCGLSSSTEPRTSALHSCASTESQPSFLFFWVLRVSAQTPIHKLSRDLCQNLLS